MPPSRTSSLAILVHKRSPVSEISKSQKSGHVSGCRDLTSLCLRLCTLVKLREKAGPPFSCLITCPPLLHSLVEECRGKQWDTIALPGGMPGAERLRDSAALKELLLAQSAAGKLTAAVCASRVTAIQTRRSAHLADSRRTDRS